MQNAKCKRRRHPSDWTGRRSHCILYVPFLIALVLSITAGAQQPAPTIKITSPLGRTDLPGKVRFVARVTTPDKRLPTVVRFYVDQMLLASDTDGPPYVAEWDDPNPFEPRSLAVEADFTETPTVRDQLDLKPLDVIETAQIMSVGVDATVQDRDGHYVRGLTPESFDLREDNTPQAIETLSAEDVPGTFALVIDSSQSMARSIDSVRRTAAALTNYVRQSDEIIVAPFKNGVFDVTGPTRDHETVVDAISAIRPAGSTAIMDALITVATHFDSSAQRRVIVLITDGYDESSEASIDDVIPVLKRAQTTVYVIAVNGIAGISISGQDLLRRFASETGGKAFFPWNAAQIAAAHAAIADDARSRYRLTYTPTNQRQDGTLRKIDLAVKNQDYVVRSRTGYVAPSPPPVRATLEFAATDSADEYVDLALEDLKVIEDGVPQTIDVFREAIAPMSIMVALDASGSMTRAAPAVRDAVRTFIGAVRPNDQLGMLMFGNGVSLTQPFSLDRAESLQGVDAYQTGGGTALYDALSEGLVQLGMRDGRRALILMSDGRDENAASNGPGSLRRWDDVLQQARELDAAIYPIGLGSNVDRARLTEIARLTGGEVFFAAEASELQRHYLRIVEAMRRSWIVGYTSTNPARNGAWRKVEIQSLLDGVRVRSRGGYFAPEQ